MALPQTKLNCSLSQVRNSASYALKGAVKDTSHSLSGNNYVGAKSFGHDPRKSFQALRYDLNGGRSSIFNMGTRESLNYVAGPTVGPQVYGPSKMQQVTEVITAATGLTKTIFDAIGEINKARGSRSVSSTTGTGSKDNTTLQNEAGNYASNIGSGSFATASSLVHSMKHANNSSSLRIAMQNTADKISTLEAENQSLFSSADELQAANESIGALKSQASDAKSTAEKKRSSVKGLQAAVTKCKANYETALQNQNIHDKEVRTLSSEVISLETKQKAVGNKLETLNNNKKTLTDGIGKLEGEISSLESDIASITDENLKSTKKAELATKKAELASVEAQITVNQTEFNSLGNKITAKKGALDTAEGRLTQDQKDILKNNQEIKDAQAKLEEAENNLKANEEAAEKLDAEAKQKEADAKILEQKVKKHEDNKADIASLKAELQSQQARLTKFENDEETEFNKHNGKAEAARDKGKTKKQTRKNNKNDEELSTQNQTTDRVNEQKLKNKKVGADGNEYSFATIDNMTYYFKGDEIISKADYDKATSAPIVAGEGNADLDELMQTTA